MGSEIVIALLASSISLLLKEIIEFFRRMLHGRISNEVSISLDASGRSIEEMKNKKIEFEQFLQELKDLEKNNVIEIDKVDYENFKITFNAKN